MHNPDRDDDIREEIETHLRMDKEERIARGLSPEAAHHAALREFGNRTTIAEDVRAVWRWTFLDHTLADFRLAVRSLAKARAFSLTAVFLIALGVGVNAIILSILDTVLRRPMPGVAAANIVSVAEVRRDREGDPSASLERYLQYAAQTKSLVHLHARRSARLALTHEGQTLGLRGGLVTPNYFDSLGVQLILGRPFAPGLDTVISYPLWRDRFASDPAIAGKTVILNGRAVSVAGVAPPFFTGAQAAEQIDLWVPLETFRGLFGWDEQVPVDMAGRLAPGATRESAQAEFDILAPRVHKDYRVSITPYSAIGPGLEHIRAMLRALPVPGFLILLIVCANITNLTLARSTARLRDLAIRQAIGASRLRLFTHLLAEGLVLSSAAWVVALLLCTAAARYVPRLLGVPLDFTPDLRIAGYGLLLASLAALIFTVAPAWLAWKQQPLAALKSSHPGLAAHKPRLARILIVVQLSLSLVLLTAAGLLHRSAANLQAFEPQFEKRNLLLFTVDTMGIASRSSSHHELLRQLLTRLRAHPSVVSASFASRPPFAWSNSARCRLESMVSVCNQAGDGYFTMLGVPPVQGRDFTPADIREEPLVAIVNRQLAAALWKNQNPIGQTLRLKNGSRNLEVIGVVPDSTFGDIRLGAHHPYLFLPYHGRAEATFHVRFHDKAEQVLGAIQSAAQGLRLPVYQVRTLDEELRESTLPAAVIVLPSLIAFIAILVASIGLYGLVAIHTARRVQEFAIRAALGATARSLWFTALSEGLRLTAAGLAAGIPLSLAVSQALRSVLFGVRLVDPIAWTSVCAILIASSILACGLPAYRAARLNPLPALRQD